VQKIDREDTNHGHRVSTLEVSTEAQLKEEERRSKQERAENICRSKCTSMGTKKNVTMVATGSYIGAVCPTAQLRTLQATHARGRTPTWDEEHASIFEAQEWETPAATKRERTARQSAR